MDQPPLPRTEQDRHLHLPHKKRWEALRPVITQLYTGNHGQGGTSTKLSEVVAFMRQHYSFHAAESEYPRHFRAWNVSKRVIKDDMNQIIGAIERRKRSSTCLGEIIISEGGIERPVQLKKVRRYLGEHSTIPQMSLFSGWFSSWNLPYTSLVQTLPLRPDQPSPFGTGRATPNTITIRSPIESNRCQEAATRSLDAHLVLEKVRFNRASLFLQGPSRRDEFLSSMCREDRRITVDYLHEFFLRGFIMAKYWGKEVPLDIEVPGAGRSSPGISSNAMPEFLGNPASDPTTASTSSLVPSSLCKWGIHEEDVWPEPCSVPETSFAEVLRESFLTNDFTETPVDSLPLAKAAIATSLSRDSDAMAVDAWKLAIVSGNCDLLEVLCVAFDSPDQLADFVSSLHPFHLAAAFLSGRYPCCHVLQVLQAFIAPSQHNIDNFGHTILDAFVVTILRSHTRVDPSEVSQSFRSEGRFPGEDKDICGRWDVETPIIRELHRHGHVRIPENWKHPFCHTSVQAICHSLTVIYGAPDSPDINTMSGLFVRQCTKCGLRGRLGPLHLLAVVAFHMVQRGMEGETLFGVLATTVCLLSLSADSCLKVQVILDDAQGSEKHHTCHHPSVSPAELMLVLEGRARGRWSKELRDGWDCLYQTLGRAEQFPAAPKWSKDWDQDIDWDCEWPQGWKSRCDPEGKDFMHQSMTNFACIEPRIGRLWATIQTEILTYRRLGAEEPWLSGNFSLKDAVVWLRGGSEELKMPIVSKMACHSKCGWFHEAQDPFFPLESDVVQEQISNFNTSNDRAQRLKRHNWSEVQESWIRFQILDPYRRWKGQLVGEFPDLEDVRRRFPELAATVYNKRGDPAGGSEQADWV